MSIELERMTPSRAAYFMERFKHEEKLLGPNEQAALTYVIDMLEKTADVQQPEPVACATPDGLKSNWRAHHVIVNKAALQMVRNALRNDVERGLKVRGEMLAELDSATFQAHPAPSVRDAERYRWLRDPKNHAQIGVGQWTDDGFGWRYSDEADAAIDAAMLAAK